MTTDSYTTAGTFSWVCPAGVTSVTVECVGAGGGGDGGGLGTTGGGGGRGGDYASSVVSVTPGTSYTVVVGAGGAGAPFDTTAVGSHGTGSRFNNGATILVGAAGGRGGSGSTGATSANSDVVTSGSTVNLGTSGGNGSPLSGGTGNGGAGGAGGTPRGGAGGTGGITTSGARAGGAGTPPGGGGGGGFANSGGTGGSGAAGAVYITYSTTVTLSPSLIASTSAVHSPTVLQTDIKPSAIASTAQVFAPTMDNLGPLPEPGDTPVYEAHPPIIKVTTHSRPEVRVGGYWLSSIVPHWGDLKTSTRKNGDWQCSFSIAVEGHRGHWRHPALVFGAPVEVYFGPARRWVGSLTEPDWDSGEMVALGACRDAEKALSMTAAGLATTVPNTAIDAAISRGVVSWTRLDNFGTTAVGQADDTGGLVTLQSVLDAWAAENNSGWRVDRQRRLTIAPTTESVVDWFIVPGAGVMGSADDDRVDRVFVRYLASTTGTLATASYPASTPVGGNEQPIDITDRGVMTSTKATSIAQAEWEKLRGRSGWTNGLTLTRGQITTPGGVLADMSMIRAGHTVRLLGVPDPRGLAQNIDVVIGDTFLDWTEESIQINPVGLAARDTESVLEEVGNLAVDALAATGARVGTTGYIPMTSSLAGVTAEYKAGGGFCTVRLLGSGTVNNNTHTTVVSAANGLPAGVRPSANAWGGGLIANFAAGGIGVNTDGSIVIHQDSGASQTGSVAVTFTFPIG